MCAPARSRASPIAVPTPRRAGRVGRWSGAARRGSPAAAGIVASGRMPWRRVERARGPDLRVGGDRCLWRSSRSLLSFGLCVLLGALLLAFALGPPWADRGGELGAEQSAAGSSSSRRRSRSSWWPPESSGRTWEPPATWSPIGGATSLRSPPCSSSGGLRGSRSIPRAPALLRGQAHPSSRLPRTRSWSSPLGLAS